MGIAYKMAMRYLPDYSSIPIEDSEEFSDACLALCKAEKGFKPTKGFEFSTLAFMCTQREVFNQSQKRYRKRFYHLDEKDYLDVNDHRTSLPEDTVAFAWKSAIIKQMIDDSDLDDRSYSILMLREAYSWTLTEVAEEFGISRERVRQIMKVTIRKIRETAFTRDGKLINRYARSI